MARDELEALQWRRLRAALRLARAGSPFWRARMAGSGVDPDRIGSTLEFIERFPITRRQDLESAEAVRPPYGDLPSVDPGLARHEFEAGGGAGGRPLRWFDTARDWAWSADIWATGLFGAGVRPGDRVVVIFGSDETAAPWGLQAGLERLGAVAIPVNSSDPALGLRVLRQRTATALAATPTYAHRLAMQAAETEVDLRGSGLRLVLTLGEPRPAATRRAIERAFGARCLDLAATLEAGSLVMFECAERPGASHAVESEFIEEVIDPWTLRACEYGRVGVRVITGLGREGVQVFRYWTDQLVQRRPAAECVCGRGWDFYEGGILGSFQEIRELRGVQFTPVMVEDVVRDYPEIEEYQLALVDDADGDALVLRLEPRAGLEPDRIAVLAEAIRSATSRRIGINPRVEVVGNHNLPRFETLAYRFRDERRQGSPA